MMLEQNMREQELHLLSERTGVSSEILQGLPQERLREYFSRSADAPSMADVAIDCGLTLVFCTAGMAALLSGLAYEEGAGVAVSLGLVFAIKAGYGITDRQENKKLAAEIKEETHSILPEKAGTTSAMKP